MTGAVSSGVGEGIKYGAEKIKSRALDVVGSAVWREIWQQGKNGFDGWTSGPGLNWSGITGSLFNVGFDALGPVLGGPKVGPKVRVQLQPGGIDQQCLQPELRLGHSGQRKEPDGRCVRIRLQRGRQRAASMGYNWIRDQLERPSAPPKVTGPRSVDQSRGPLPAELLDAFDEADRRYIDELDRMARLAQNEQIAAASDENLQRQLQIAAVNDSIDHLGENDRAIIAATLRQQYYERVQRVQAAARASHEAMLRAAKRLQAKIDRGPDFGDYPRTQDELNNEIAQDQYAQGFSVGVLATTYIDGIPVERGSGIYDTLFGRGNLLLDEEVERYREFRKQDPSLAGLEIIAIRDRSTAAELARRSGQVDLPTFNQSRKTLERMYRTSETPEQLFLDYRFKLSPRIEANWRRTSNAAGAGLLIAKATIAGVGFVFYPAGTASLAAGWGTEKGLRFAGVDEHTAALFGNIVGLGTGSVLDPAGTLGLLTVGWGTAKLLSSAGVNQQDAAILGSIAGGTARGFFRTGSRRSTTSCARSALRAPTRSD